MCVLVCRIGSRPFVAANRDEAYARPFTPPRPWVAPVPFLAPRDEEEGGTWIGVNTAGVVAAITNRSKLPEAKGLASRGHLVTGVLSRAAVDDARRWLEAELARAPRNPFQLLALRDADAFLCRHGPDGTTIETLAPGVHTLSNLHEPDEVAFDLGPDPGPDELRAAMSDTSPRLPGGYAVCKRVYRWRGTVSSAILAPRDGLFLFAGGPPDETPYRRYPLSVAS